MSWLAYEGPFPQEDGTFLVRVMDGNVVAHVQTFGDEETAGRWISERTRETMALQVMHEHSLPAAASVPRDGGEGTPWSALIPHRAPEMSAEAQMLKGVAAAITTGTRMSPELEAALKWQLQSAREKSDLMIMVGRAFQYAQIGRMGARLESVEHRLFEEIGVNNLEPGELITLYGLLQKEMRATLKHLSDTPPVSAPSDSALSKQEEATKVPLLNAPSRNRVVKTLERIAHILKEASAKQAENTPVKSDE
jgi:hypothetical protein